MVSIITRAYNREDTIGRSIESVLAQDYHDWDLIIVDDGSTDQTLGVVAKYPDPRIRVIRHTRNRGLSAALNTGVENIKGEWFTVLDSDDEMVVPNALSTLLAVPRTVDPRIDAVECNSLDTMTGGFRGKGLEGDQFLDAETIVRKCRGDFWGMKKTALLGNDRFLEQLDIESIVWGRVNKRAHTYYIHKALLIVHSEGTGHANTAVRSNEELVAWYGALLEQTEFLEDYRKWRNEDYRDIHFNAALYFIRGGYRKRAFQLLRKILPCKKGFSRSAVVCFGLVLGKPFVQILRTFKRGLLRA